MGVRVVRMPNNGWVWQPTDVPGTGGGGYVCPEGVVCGPRPEGWPGKDDGLGKPVVVDQSNIEEEVVFEEESLGECHKI